jgi:flagellar biogenesis protein FliO
MLPENVLPTMTHSRKLLSFICLAILFVAGLSSPLIAEDANQDTSVADESSGTAGDGESMLLQPQKIDERYFSAEEREPNLTWAVYLFLLMVVVLVGLWVYQRRGGNLPVRLGTSGELKICETKPLGNRQFLVVVAYGEQKMLLGVAPGMINHLCYLEESAELVEGVVPGDADDLNKAE